MSIVNLDFQWEWLKRYYVDMLHSIEKTREDNRERGFFIIQAITRAEPHTFLFVKRTRVQVGTSGRVILKMKDLANIKADDKLMSFHTHICTEHDYPSIVDKRTAIALGEEYTVIGYVDDSYPAQPHIKVWRIYRKMDGKSVGARYRFKF